MAHTEKEAKKPAELIRVALDLLEELGVEPPDRCYHKRPIGYKNVCDRCEGICPDAGVYVLVEDGEKFYFCHIHHLIDHFFPRTDFWQMPKKQGGAEFITSGLILALDPPFKDRLCFLWKAGSGETYFTLAPSEEDQAPEIFVSDTSIELDSRLSQVKLPKRSGYFSLILADWTGWRLVGNVEIHLQGSKEENSFIDTGILH